MRRHAIRWLLAATYLAALVAVYLDTFHWRP